MGDLSKLPNIGAKCEKRLTRVGIKSAEELKRIGSREAFIKLYFLEGDTCFNTLCALEGAIQGKRWHDLSDESKTDLKKFYVEVTRNMKED
ncbi:TfoX/Sxy family protein [Acetivibrio clariflavus]|uniref:TfoX C-terminal domain-containing protein n=1 Tax=Acetivibrio clariflavus (strain DSM 19732 / NBRC 101661 / EBR45) TaxID=720554 RepID=G8LWX5_ACECE|nr:TfoX/Sxy family protein [Acetivibrio clariflavus]AEV67627.1 TfoX C-terminal domain-containing protein [Acetivibrio clariflavus DSM 19732]